MGQSSRDPFLDKSMEGISQGNGALRSLSQLCSKAITQGMLLPAAQFLQHARNRGRRLVTSPLLPEGRTAEHQSVSSRGGAGKHRLRVPGKEETTKGNGRECLGEESKGGTGKENTRWFGKGNRIMMKEEMRMDGQQPWPPRAKDNKVPCSSQPCIPAHMLQPEFPMQGSHTHSGMGFTAWRLKKIQTVPFLTSLCDWSGGEVRLWKPEVAILPSLYGLQSQERGLCCAGRCWTALKNV